MGTFERKEQVGVYIGRSPDREGGLPAKWRLAPKRMARQGVWEGERLVRNAAAFELVCTVVVLVHPMIPPGGPS